MKIIPAGLVFFVCCGTGLLRSMRLRRRLELLSELRQMLAEFSVGISFTAPTLDELAQSACGIFGKLLRGCREELPDIKSAWERACQSLERYSWCGAEEAGLLKSLGRSLGTSCAQGQLSLIALYAERLESLERSASEEYERKGKLFRSVGALAGAAAAVLIL